MIRKRFFVFFEIAIALHLVNGKKRYVKMFIASCSQGLPLQKKHEKTSFMCHLVQQLSDADSTCPKCSIRTGYCRLCSAVKLYPTRR
ncbi:hypothetical protein D3C71_1105440 [compost metagenome]